MKTKLFAVLLLAGASLFAAPRVVVGVGVGGYVGPRAVVAYGPPPAPLAYSVPVARPGYSWVGGYWYPSGARWAWRAGYWTRPPYARARWVAPRYYGHHWYRGYWRR